RTSRSPRVTRRIAPSGRSASGPASKALPSSTPGAVSSSGKAAGMGKVGRSIVIVPDRTPETGRPRRAVPTGVREEERTSVGDRVRSIRRPAGGGTGGTGGPGLIPGCGRRRWTERRPERDLAEEDGGDESDDRRSDAEPDAVGDRDRQRPVEALDEDRLRLGRDLGEEVATAPRRRGELGDVEARWRIDRDQRRLRAGSDHLLAQERPAEVDPEERVGGRDPDRRPDLAEQRQVARRRPELVERDRVLDHDREHGERRPDAEPGDEHPAVEHPVVRPDAELRDQDLADDQRGEAEEDERLVPSRPADELARRDRADDQPEHERQEAIPGLGGRRALDDEEVERQEDDQRAEAERREEDREHRRRERPVPEQVERDDRLGGAAFHEDEGHDEHEPATDPRPDR